MHQNIERLVTRIEPLQIILHEIDPTILILTEHDVKENEIATLKIDGYIIDAYYCRKSSNKGGVMILSKVGVECRQLVVPAINSLCEDKQIEFCLTLYIFQSIQIVIVGIYRSPSSNVFEFLVRLNLLVLRISRKFKNIVIAGDLNINILEDSKESREFKSLIRSHGIAYIVDFPTRYCETTKTCIDNILTNIPKNMLQVEGLVTHLSDHDAQTLVIDLPISNVTTNNVTYYKRKFSDSNKALFLKFLSHESWLDVYNSTIEDKFDTFFSIFYYYFDLCFPKLKCRQIKRKKIGYQMICY